MHSNLAQKIRNQTTKLLHYTLLIVILIFSLSFIRSIKTSINTTRKIEEAQNKLQDLKNKQNELNKDLEKVTSDLYIEKQARDKLGLAKEGETVVIMPSEELLKSIAKTKEEEKFKLPDPNWKKWLHLFVY